MVLYKVKWYTVKWYSPIVHFCFNVAVVAGWLVYKRFMGQLGKSRKSVMALKDFQCERAHALAMAGKRPIKRKWGRLPNDASKPPKRGNSSSS